MLLSSGGSQVNSPVSPSLNQYPLEISVVPTVQVSSTPQGGLSSSSSTNVSVQVSTPPAGGSSSSTSTTGSGQGTNVSVQVSTPPAGGSSSSTSTSDSGQGTNVSLQGATQGTTDSPNQNPLPSPQETDQSSSSLNVSYSPVASQGNSLSDTETTASQAAAEPTISLHYSAGTGKTAVSVTLVSSPVSSTPDQRQFITSTSLDSADQAKEVFELTPRGIWQLPDIPSGLDVVVSGNLGPGQLFMTFRMQVGPQTGSLQLIISGSESPSAPVEPALDQLYLVSSNGTVLTELSGVSALAHGSQENMTIGLNEVPVGAQLLARVVESSNTTAALADASGSSTNQNIPFTLEVRRPNLSIGTTAIVPVFSAGTADPIAGLVSAFLGLLASTTFTTGESSLAVNEPGTSTSGIADQLQTTDATVLTSSASLSQVASPIRTAMPGVSMGPLASRGSAPLGPSLGTTQEEPTPMVDRAERAFDLATTGSDAGADLELSPQGDGSGRDDTGSGSRGDGFGSFADRLSRLVVVRNPGGLPILTGALKIEPSSVDRVSILASLAGEMGSLEDEHQLGLPADSRFQVIQPDPDLSGGAICTDFFTTASGLLLGIGLTSGPLYPDMITFVRHWLPRRMRRAIRSRADAERLRRLS